MAKRYFENIQHAELYSKFRPSPPRQLINTILDFMNLKFEKAQLWTSAASVAVDVGCGSGQSTLYLSEHFDKVIGLDVSPSQIEFANKHNHCKNVHFYVGVAENTFLPDESVDLVYSSIAAHYFDLPKYYEEARRILVKNGVIVTCSYAFPLLLSVNQSEPSDILEQIFCDDLGSYWPCDKEIVHTRYGQPRFQLPFKDFVRCEDLNQDLLEVSVRDVIGFIRSTSTFERYKEANGEEILVSLENRIMEEMQLKSTAETNLTMRFPFFLLMGRK